MTAARSDDRFTPDESPTRPGLIDIVRTLATEAQERSIRDRSMLAIGERIARGVEAMVVETRELQQRAATLGDAKAAPGATRWPTAAWVAIALSCGVLGAAIDRALVAPQQEVQHVR